MLGSLIVGMSASAAALAWLEPQDTRAGTSADEALIAAVAKEARLICQTDIPIEKERWGRVTVRQAGGTLTSGSDVEMPRDGEGCHFIVDGSGRTWVGYLWRIQRPSAPADAAIHVFLPDDWGRGGPSDAQLRGASRLVWALRHRCDIGGRSVVFPLDPSAGRGGRGDDWGPARPDAIQ